MRSLNSFLEATPLDDGQKVLALTFMHGSRRRLEERLGQLRALRGRTDCTTIDSFAWRLVRRWLSLVTALGFQEVHPDQYEKICNAAGALLELNEVRAWVVATFPVLLLDEAQDLTRNRLKIVESLSTRLEVFAAADEFQCLDESLCPNPACTWLAQVCSAEELTQPRRTNNAELLNAAAAIRRGKPPVSGDKFKIQLASNIPFAGTWISGNLRFYGAGKRVAVISPTFRGFGENTLKWIAENPTKKGWGPYSVLVEASEGNAAAQFLNRIAIQETNDISSVVSLLSSAGDSRTTRDLTDWMENQRRTRAKIIFSRGDIAHAIEQSFAQRRRARAIDRGGWRAMTVHGAKNREFDNVIVIWPASTSGGDDYKRRLLYNAVTRAKDRCLVLVQARANLDRAPFA